MKKYIIACLLLITIPAAASVYDDMAGDIFKKIPQKNRTKAIAVMPFKSTGRQMNESAAIAVSEMEKALVDQGAVVSERGEIDKLVKEQELQQTGLLTDAAASEIGQGVGAKYILLGSVALIDKYGESGNKGVKISVKLVDVATYKIIAASSGEAALSDSTSKYRRQTVKKAPEYPEFIQFYGGLTRFYYHGDFDEVLGSGSEVIHKDMKTGYILGLRYVNDNKGFLTTMWDFNYTSQEMDSAVEEIKTFQLSWIPVLRIPLWTYTEMLGDYSNLYFGYSISAGIDRVDYTDLGKEKSSTGFGFCTSPIIGFQLGLSESIGIFCEARYTPGFLNKYWRNQDVNGNNSFVDEEMRGPAFYAGISIAP